MVLFADYKINYKKYAHVLCLIVVNYSFFYCWLFSIYPTPHDYFTGTELILCRSQSYWSNSKDYGEMCQMGPLGIHNMTCGPFY